MYAQIEKPKENNSRAVANSVAQKKNNGKQNFGFVDNRPETIAQRKLKGSMNNSPQTKQAAQFKAMVNDDPGLEKEAGVMGKIALQRSEADHSHDLSFTSSVLCHVAQAKSVIQLDKKSKKRKREKAGLGKLYQAELLVTNLENGVDTGEEDAFDVVRIANEVVQGLAEQDIVIRALLQCSETVQTAVVEDASSLNYIVNAILRDYAPASHVFVGIGASPEVLMGLLELRGMRTASIPVSGVKNAVPKNEGEWNNAIVDVRNFLDPWGSRDVDLLLLDATDTKATLEVITQVIKLSDKNLDLSRDVKSASISETKTHDGGREKLNASDIDILDINDLNPDRTVNREGYNARKLIREKFFFQWYKENLGRAVEKRSFSDVVKGLNPAVEENDDATATMGIFTSAVHSFDSLNSRTLRRAQNLLARGEAMKGDFFDNL